MQAHFPLLYLSDNFRPMQVIGSQLEDSRKLCDTKTESLAFNAEVDGGLIPITTPPSSGTELSDQFYVPVLKDAKNIKDVKCLSFGEDLVEHWITLLLHIRPINIQLWSARILSVLDDGEVPIHLEVAPKPMVMKLSGPLIRIIIPDYH
jgi:hypothetical protein